MSDKPVSAARTVSLNKQGSSSTPSAAGPRPRPVLLAAGALLLAGLASLIAALSLYGQRGWLTSEQHKANAKAITTAVNDAVKKAQSTHADVAAAKAKAIADETKKLGSVTHAVSQQQSGAVIGAAIVLLAVGFLAYGVYRGRSWSRWAVIVFWFLASFTGTLVGLGAVLNVGSSAPAPFKVPAFVAGVAMIAAVVLVNLKPSTDYFLAHRPVPAAGAPVRRGLFAPRTPPPSRPAADKAAGRATRRSSTAANGASGAGDGGPRQRAKTRAAANADAVARGAELARQRAKANKSRRAAE